MIEVESTNVQGRRRPGRPVLDINGKRHPITRSRTVIGRGSDADITVDDTGISRKHVEILWDGTRAQVNDLGSTNGSRLNGSPSRRRRCRPTRSSTSGVPASCSACSPSPTTTIPPPTRATAHPALEAGREA